MHCIFLHPCVCFFLQVDQFELSAEEQTAAQAAIAADMKNEEASNADADADLKAEADETQVRAAEL